MGADTRLTEYKKRIATHHFVRFHMMLILLATGAAGVAASRLLLGAGVTSVMVRYPLAAVFGYIVLLALVRLWVAYIHTWPSASLAALAAHNERKSRRKGSGAGDLLEAADAIGDVELPLPRGGGDGFRGFGGGSSGGGGASGGWTSNLTAAETNLPLQSSVSTPPTGSGGGSWLPSLNLDFDLDGDAVWLLVILGVVILVLVGAGGYLVYAAPEILPEIALEAALVPVVARAARRADAGNWALSALRATLVPFLIALLAVTGLGYAVQWTCPGAQTFAQSLNCPVDVPASGTANP